jgi:hypothetical protein
MVTVIKVDKEEHPHLFGPDDRPLQVPPPQNRMVSTELSNWFWGTFAVTAFFLALGVGLVAASSWFWSSIVICIVGAGVPFFAYYPTFKSLRIGVREEDRILHPLSHEITAVIVMFVGAFVVAGWFIHGAFGNQDVSNCRYMTNAQLRARTTAETNSVRQLIVDERRLDDAAEQREEVAWQFLFHYPPRPPTTQEQQTMDKLRQQQIYESQHAMRRTLEEYELYHRVDCMLLRDELRRRLQIAADPSMDSKYEAANIAGGTWELEFVADDLDRMSRQLPRQSFRSAWRDFFYGHD